jgi:hypothetical protein
MGKGTVTVNGTLDTPYAVEFADGRRIHVGGGSVSFENFEIGEERATLHGSPTVGAALRVDRDDTDSRIVIVALAGIWLAAAWVGLLSLRAVVGSVGGGAPFAAENPNRLRRLAAAILGVGLSGLVAEWILSATIDVDLPFRVSLDTAAWLVAVVVGLGVLALAEPFAEAARLREMDEATI